jgi:lipopolysaccharide/colanic/teichoic acid biosynthesis glycosyltransferase
LPIFAIIGILIKLDSKGPVFFVQERVGKDGKILRAYKLRTMVLEAEKMTGNNPIDKKNPYITRIGKVLRRTGIDELPQLINVIMGDMSLVGPRPTILCQVKEYDDFQIKRLLVKPGITGWALINGRNNLNWSERIKLDIWYIEHWSLWLDIKIIFKTIIVIIIGEGLYVESKDVNVLKK